MLALILAVGGIGCAEPEAAAKPAAGPVPVRVETVSPRRLERTREATGTIDAIDSAELRPEVQGLVEAVLFEDGARVAKGQALVRLRAADARANLNDAEARAALADAGLGRTRTLEARGDVARADLERAEAEAKLARAAVARAEEALRRTTVLAPFDGVAGRREVSVGELVDPSRVITRIEGLSRLVVDAALPEDALAEVAPGQAATVHALGQDFTGSVTYVAPRVAEGTRTVALRVALAEPGPLRPGMTAQVRVITAEVPDALMVPTQAIARSASGAAVWVVADGDTVERRPVTTGQRDAERAEVVSGLAAGERVVVEGLARMRPGASVAIKADEAPR